MAGRSALRGRSTVLRFCLLTAAVVGALALLGPASAFATEAPIAAWSFDEGHGEVAHDVYGSHDGELEHSPTDQPPEWANGRFGDSLRFQGQGYQCVNVPQSPDLELQESFTIETWVKPEGSGVEEPLIFKEAAPGHEAYLGYMLYLGLESNGKVGGYVEEPGYVKPEVTSEKLPAGKWTHLALSFDGSTLRLYVDGEVVDSAAAEGPQATKGPLKFGCSEIYGQDFEGRLDEVRIYDRAISGEEVAHDMTSALQTPDPSQAPVAAYSFDEEASPGTDLSGDGRDATLEGATWTPHGRYGGAVQLDGEDSLSIPASPGLHVEEEFTVEAWVRPEGKNEWAPLISKETEGTVKAPWFLYEGSWGSNLPYGGLEGESPGETYSNANEAIPQDRWTQLAFTFDGSKTRLYVDGELVDEDAGTEPAISEGKIELGADQAGNHFKGRIDEVRIYNRALGTGELAADMEAPLQTPKSGPVAAWAFDEGAGETAVDTTGDEHTATLEGGAKWTPHGKYGSGLEFNGSYEECARTPDAADLRLGDDFTISAWVKPGGTGEHEAILFKETEYTGGYALYLGEFEDGHIEGYVGEPGYKFATTEDPSAMPEDVWTDVTLTFDGTRLKLYVDGSLVDTAAAKGAQPTAGPLSIGCSGEFHDGFIGRIDEVRAYDRALNAAEVAADMEAPIQTPKQTPVADYSFDEEGEIYEDGTGDGHTATAEDVKWSTKGRYGGAVELDGEEGCLTIPASEELQFSEELTLEAWVRPEGSAEEAGPVITQEDPEAAEGEEPYAYELLAGENEVPKAWIRKAGSGYEGIYGKEPLPERTWSHVALTDDGAQLRLYVDGELVRTVKAPPLTLASGDLKIGCDIWGGTFQGRIDELRIYNRALNTAEVGADKEAPIESARRGPVAEYSFDDGNEEAAADGTGNEHAGTVEGATKAPGKFGQSLQFDGEEDCVKVPVDEELQASEEFTLEAWVRPEGTGEEGLPVIAMDDENSGPGEEQFSYELFGGQEEVPKGWVRKAGESGTWGVYGEEPLPEKSWSHLTLTDDGHVIRLYVDGKLGNEENSTDVAPPLTEAEGPLTIGCGIKYGAYRYFKGRIDEVRVYDRALDAAEVASDTESPIQTPRQGPVAAYSFDEGEGTTVEDLTGDEHTATIHGAEWTTRGKYGGAMEFDAAKESYLSIPDSPELKFTEEFTLEAWVRPAEGSGEYEPLITKQTTGSTAQPYFLYEGSSEADHPYGGTQANTKEESYAQAPDPLPSNTWSHVALTFSGTRAKVYVNGELVDENYACPPINGEGDLEIGGASEVASYFSGRIDEVRIYSRALNGTEVESSMSPLPKAVTDAPYGIDDVSAVLTGEMNPKGVETGAIFEYGTTKAYGSRFPETEAEIEKWFGGRESIEVEQAVNGLEPETTYHYRVIATNSTGRVVGRDQTFTTTASQPEPAIAASEFGGLVGINWSGNPNTFTKPAMENVAASKAKIFRVVIGAGWTPGEKKLYKEHTDRLFEFMANHHIEVLPDVSGIPGLPTDEPGKSGLSNRLPPIGPGSVWRERWIAGLKELASRYGKGGQFWQELGIGEEYAPEYWEIWNEENAEQNADYGSKAIDPARYGVLLEISHDALKSVDKRLKVVFGGLITGPRNHPRPPESHLEVGVYIRKAKHASDYEALSLHPYAFIGSNAAITGKVESNIEAARKSLNSNGGKSTPIWVTELGWPVDSEGVEHNGVQRPVSEATQKARLEAVFTMMKERSRGRHGLDIENVLWYNIEDWVAGSPNPAAWAGHCGLIRANGKRRGAFSAFQVQAE